ncbi:MAG: hydroxyacylglutathione hydrolase [Inquilinus sp.]|nr:hydroxyacylglutathione hydrolase [Inquilinus sp.]
MAALEIDILPALSDNYIYLLRDVENGTAAVVDPSTAEPVIAALEERGLGLGLILNTHHHHDHIGGNAALKARYGATIIGPRSEISRIPALDRTVGQGDQVSVGGETAAVIETPGHTSGHIAFWFPTSKALFCGDTLFALGCGRLFEGTPAEMWASLLKLRDLPDDTRIYCGHEYTQSNARFALTVEPDNAALAERAERIDATRAQGLPTIPSTIGEEKATNPFLRADVESLKRGIGMPGCSTVTAFAELRGRKDRF